jgi:hypothetical protein
VIDKGLRPPQRFRLHGAEAQRRFKGVLEIRGDPAEEKNDSFLVD